MAVKIHPRSEHNGRAALAELAGAQAARQLETQAGQVVRFERDGETFPAMAQPLEGLGWALIAEVPEAEIFGEGAAHALDHQPDRRGHRPVLSRRYRSAGARPWFGRSAVTAALVEIGGGGGDLTRRPDENRADELGDRRVASTVSSAACAALSAMCSRPASSCAARSARWHGWWTTPRCVPGGSTR